jgi:hypothetical protein
LHLGRAVPTNILRDWLPLPRLARITATSEDPAHPVISAFGARGERGWQAERVGPQLISVRFREPMALGRVRLVFDEDQRERTQEFTLACGLFHGGQRELARQQFTFSPSGATRQIEEFVVDADGVTELMLRIVPDISHARVLATLSECRVAARAPSAAARAGQAEAEPRGDALGRIVQAYRELPGLSLTRPQACLLFELEPGHFDGLLGELVGRGILRENERGQVLRATP